VAGGSACGGQRGAVQQRQVCVKAPQTKTIKFNNNNNKYQYYY